MLYLCFFFFIYTTRNKIRYLYMHDSRGNRSRLLYNDVYVYSKASTSFQKHDAITCRNRHREFRNTAAGLK